MARLLLLVAAALLLASFSSASATATTTPLFAWSSSAKYFASDPGPVLEAVTDLAAALGDLLDGVVRPGAAAGEGEGSPLLDHAAVAGAPPEVVLVLLGSELRTSDLRRKHAAELRSLVDAAESSVALPYVVHEDASPVSLEQLQRAIEERLPASAGGKLQTAGCGEGRGLAELPGLVAPGGGGGGSGSGGPRVVLGCTAAAAGAAAGTKEAVAEELRQVRAAHDAVASLGRRQVTLFAVRPGGAAAAEEEGEGPAERRRSLQQVRANVGTCDALCRTQVKWLEGMLALLLLIIATLSGLCCLGVLDTPTRFESPKDAQRND